MKVSLVTSLPITKTDAYLVAVNNQAGSCQLPDAIAPKVDVDLCKQTLASLKGDAIALKNIAFVEGAKTAELVLATTGKHQDHYARKQWVQAVAAHCLGIQALQIAIDLPHTAAQWQCDQQDALQILVLEFQHAFYSFNRYKKDAKKAKIVTLSIVTEKDNKALVSCGKQAKAIADGQQLARDLGNMAPNDCDIDHLHSVCTELSSSSAKLKLNLINEKQMTKRGMGAFLAVCRGSEQSPKLLILEYNNGPKKQQPIVILGKGLTFDAGGISLKPAAGMDEMKFDMCGAASVLGLCKAIIALQPKINLVFAVAAAENMPSGAAVRPGDVVKTMSGQYVEVLNTDAEGRLVLCDSLTLLQQDYNPASIIDIATLTGACVIALGHHATAVFTNNDDMRDQLQSASTASADGMWPMPMWREYQDQLGSKLVDIPNIGGRDAGSVTAACFLSRFIENDTPWAHLDIAGTAWVSGKNKLATGRPVPLLAKFLLQSAAK